MVLKYFEESYEKYMAPRRAVLEAMVPSHDEKELKEFCVADIVNRTRLHRTQVERIINEWKKIPGLKIEKIGKLKKYGNCEFMKLSTDINNPELKTAIKEVIEGDIMFTIRMLTMHFKDKNKEYSIRDIIEILKKEISDPIYLKEINKL